MESILVCTSFDAYYKALVLNLLMAFHIKWPILLMDNLQCCDDFNYFYFTNFSFEGKIYSYCFQLSKVWFRNGTKI